MLVNGILHGKELAKLVITGKKRLEIFSLQSSIHTLKIEISDNGLLNESVLLEGNSARMISKGWRTDIIFNKEF